MPFSFTTDQVAKLRDWSGTLSKPENKSWYESTKAAVATYNRILSDASFQNGKELSSARIDELFRQMKVLSHNRALSNLLYKDNGLQNFNARLRLLLFGKGSLADRIDQFIDMKGVSEVTTSHFLSLHNPQEYPFFSWQTYQVLDLTKSQEQEALRQALSESSISDSRKFGENTINYLQHSIVFREVKRVLQLESYPQVNVVLWDAYDARSIDEGRPGLSLVTQENQLYAPIRKWLERNWGTQINQSGDYYWIKETANVARKGQLGKWSRPDLTFVEVNRFDLLPQRNVQVTSFEIKRADDTDLSSVYEAASHQRWAHYSYLIIEVPNKELELPENLAMEASRFGVGLMKAYPVLESPDYDLEELIAPLRQNPEPKELDKMLKDFFKEDDRQAKRFKDAIGR
jgi:hypothetical protein